MMLDTFSRFTELGSERQEMALDTRLWSINFDYADIAKGLQYNKSFKS